MTSHPPAKLLTPRRLLTLIVALVLSLSSGTNYVSSRFNTAASTKLTNVGTGLLWCGKSLNKLPIRFRT
jgi:hypothetical protein